MQKSSSDLEEKLPIVTELPEEDDNDQWDDADDEGDDDDDDDYNEELERERAQEAEDEHTADFLSLAFANAIDDADNYGMMNLISTVSFRGQPCNTPSESWPQVFATRLLAGIGKKEAIMPIIESYFFTDHDRVREAAAEELTAMGLLLPNEEGDEC